MFSQEKIKYTQDIREILKLTEAVDNSHVFLRVVTSVLVKDFFRK